MERVYSTVKHWKREYSYFTCAATQNDKTTRHPFPSRDRSHQMSSGSLFHHVATKETEITILQERRKKSCFQVDHTRERHILGGGKEKKRDIDIDRWMTITRTSTQFSKKRIICGFHLAKKMHVDSFFVQEKDARTGLKLSFSESSLRQANEVQESPHVKILHNQKQRDVHLLDCVRFVSAG